MPAPSPSPAPPQAQAPRRGLAWLIRIGPYVSLGLALLMMWDGIRWFSQVYPQELKTHHLQQLAATARAAATQLDAVFSNAESSLRTVDLWLLTQPQGEILNDAALAQLAETLRESSHDLVDVLVGSRDGRFHRLPSGQGGAPMATMSADDLAFLYGPPGTKGPLLGAPLQLRPGGPLYIPLALPMSAPP